ncbi:HMG-box [Hesseltinella vesiculosa]|uniref:HMG-box n=1 Tax=Hesseltinella vesiculosa TaxID=101127 RepID=A0A1X2GEY3_9FUNG|nr:HMG-box [Hesseltinella vesiculosa]
MPSTHSSSSSSLPSYTSKHHAPAMTIAASDDDNDDNQPPNTTFRPAQDLIQIHKPLSQPHLDPAHQRALTEPHRSSNSPPHLDPVSHFDSYHQPPSSSSSSSSILNVASYSGAAEATALEQAVASTTSKPETRLKRPPNAYLLFNKELRPKLLEEHESLSVASISKMISDQWKSLPPDEKNRYIQMAAQLKDELLKKHPDYVYTRRSRAELERVGYKSKSLKRQQNPPVTQHDHTAPEHALQLDPSIAYPSNRPFPYNHTDTHLSADKHDPTPPMPSAKKERRVPDPRGRKKKKHKNPHGPKHPMSGFLFFASHTRPEVVRDYPKYNVGMVSKVIARMWNDMSDPEKQPWVEKAIKDKARYAREMEEYNRAKQSPRDVDNSSQEYTPASSSTMTTDAATIAKASDRTRLRAMILENASHDDDDRRSHDHYYSPTSRIHSVLSHPRPNSPTEVDDDTIAAVAQMVNPKHHHIGIHQPRHDHQNHLVAPLSSSSSSTSSLQGDSPPPITALHYPQHDHESLFHRFHGPATPPSPSIEHPL